MAFPHVAELSMQVMLNVAEVLNTALACRNAALAEQFAAAAAAATPLP